MEYIYLQCLRMALSLQRTEGALILLQFAAFLQSVMLHSGHYAVFFFHVTDSILNFSLCYVMRLRYIVFFPLF